MSGGGFGLESFIVIVTIINKGLGLWNYCNHALKKTPLTIRPILYKDIRGKLSEGKGLDFFFI